MIGKHERPFGSSLGRRIDESDEPLLLWRFNESINPFTLHTLVAMITLAD
jgi:hypothetical protein